MCGKSQDISSGMKRLGKTVYQFGSAIAKGAGKWRWHGMRSPFLGASAAGELFCSRGTLLYYRDVLILAIDTCDARGSVCLLDDSGVLSSVAHKDTEEYSTWLLPAVGRALTGAGRRFSEVTLYAVAAGPGSFTGIRVGLTTVKAWNEVFGVPIVAVSRLEALAMHARGTGEGVPRFVAGCFDAERGTGVG